MTPGYRITANASLRERTTFGVPARALWLIEVDDAAALDEVLALPQVLEGDTLVIGGGSNLLFAGDAPGAVIAMATHDL
ncbi:MAG: UDP-N-acetylenolpyruvoylglucosamine reductase, partial [Stenotrophomonas acidaminiphila]